MQIKKKKKLFNYKNQIILIKGSTIKINSIKYIKNYKLNENLIKKKINNNIF